MIKSSEFHGRDDVFQHLTEKYITKKYENLRNAGLSEDAAFDELYAEDCNLDGYEDDILYIEDVTGTLGEWFDMNTDEIPTEALKALQTAYSICVKALEGGN